MKAQELMIGNYVKEQVLGIVPITEITKHTVWVMSKNMTKNKKVEEQFYHLDIENVIPVPLTEEWLLKFHSGDEIEKSGRFPNEITIYDRFKFIWKEEYKYWYVVTAYHKEYLTKIEFIHEYQNFIFALTGEELTIK